MYTYPAIATPVLKSAARTTAQAVELPTGYSSIQVVIVTTATTGGASLTPSLAAWDEASGTWITLLTGAAITGNGTIRLTIADWVATATNVSLAAKAPPKCRFSMAVADTKSVTYSVGAWLHE